MIVVKDLANYLENSNSSKLFRDIYRRITFGETEKDRRLSLARFILGVTEIPRAKIKPNRAKHGLERIFLGEIPEIHPELKKEDYEKVFQDIFNEIKNQMPGKTDNERCEKAKRYLAKQISEFDCKKYYGSPSKEEQLEFISS
jgi:AAA+ ATPase superfamily predicted ATPase